MGYHLMRSELDDEYGILSLQERILEIAVYIDQFCRENGIDYGLMGGSALGALRHKGFIPWDDDLDIFMKPSQYDKFRKLFEEEGDHQKFYLQELSERDGLVASAKMRLNNTTYIETATKNYRMHQGVFVDIFLLHNCPSNRLLQYRQCFWGKYILAKGQSYKNIKYSGSRRIIMSLLRRLPKELFMKKALKEMYRYDNRKTNKVCHFMGKAFFKKGLFDASDFETTVPVKFETVILQNPVGADKYLRERFGDYMKLPSKETIKRDQHASRWDIDNNYTKYVNKDNCYDDERILV